MNEPVQRKSAGALRVREIAQIAPLFSAVLPLLANDRSDLRCARSLVLASCSHGEGTTTIAVNLGRELARQSGTVLLIEANLETPSAALAAAAPAPLGLVDLLCDRARAEDVTWEVEDAFHCIAAGNLDGSRVDLRSLARRLGELLAASAASYDFILFDSAPLLPHPEAAILAKVVGRVCLLLEAEKTRWEVARDARRLVEAHGASIAGVILNRKKHYIPRLIYNAI